MRKVTYAMSVSVDGFIEAPDGDIRWTDPDEELHRHFNARESAIDLHLYGRRLYENMAASWPVVAANPQAEDFMKEYALLWESMPKIVFSTTLRQVGWNSRLVSGNLAEEVNRLKKEPGGEMSVSGAGLANTFMQLGLIDEVWMYLRPVLLGGGKPMFGPLRDRVSVELVETRGFGGGVILLRYRVAWLDN